MDVREKLVELLSVGCCPDDGCDFCDYVDFEGCRPHFLADHLIAHGVTVQDSKVVEIDQFKLPIDDAILILREEHKQRVDGYTTHLSYGGKGDPAEEVHIDALEMAIAALEWEKRQMPQPPKGE